MMDRRGKGGLTESGLATLSPRAGSPRSVAKSRTITSLFQKPEAPRLIKSSVLPPETEPAPATSAILPEEVLAAGGGHEVALSP